MRLAVTGGIAEGKSTVLQAIHEAGFETVSADDIARDVLHTAEVQAGLSQILGKDEPIEPATLKSALFESPKVRQDVNRLMHPAIMRMLKDHPAPVVEVPLLVESCLQGVRKNSFAGSRNGLETPSWLAA
jgi:dephospho-CoA kinase